MLLSIFLIGDIKCEMVYNPIKAFGQTLLTMFACFVAVSRLVGESSSSFVLQTSFLHIYF